MRTSSVLSIFLFVVAFSLVCSCAYAQDVSMFEVSKKVGLKDAKGKVILKPTYDKINEFREGLALVAVKNGSIMNMYHYGFIDKTGKEVIPVKYDYASGFSEGLAGVG